MEGRGSVKGKVGEGNKGEREGREKRMNEERDETISR